MTRRKFSDNKVIEALEASHGIQTVAARSLSCNRALIGRYISDRPKVAKAYAQINEAQIDIAEGRLTALVNTKDHKDHFSAIRFYLRTKGKERGYGDRLDVTSGGDPLQPPIIVAWPKQKKVTAG